MCLSQVRNCGHMFFKYMFYIQPWWFSVRSSSHRLILYSYETDFVHSLLQKKEKKCAQSFGLTFRYLVDVTSLNKSKFCDYVDRIYPTKLENNNTTEAEKSVSHLDLHLEINSKVGLWKKNFTTREITLIFPI